jgi:mannan endo-1,4-beta-mannosidase
MADLDREQIATRLRAVMAEIGALADAVAAAPDQDPDDDLDEPGTTRGVTTRGTDLLIDGKSRQVAGWNLFGASGCHQGRPYSNDALDGFFKSLPPRSLTRTWGFRPQGLDNLRHVVAAARRNDQMLIVSLGDGVSHCNDLEGSSRGQGSAKTATWYQSTYKGGYRAWVDQVTREFGTDEAIGGWEPMNEPIGQTGATLRAFLDDIGGLCKQNAPTKLVFSGQRAPYDFPDGIVGWKHAHASPGIDVCSLHEYDFSYQGSRKIVSGWWPPSLQAARDLGKPIVIGEVGIAVPGTTGETTRSRAEAFRQKFDAYFDAGAAGLLVWNRYLGPSNEGFAVKDANDPLIGVVRDASR